MNVPVNTLPHQMIPEKRSSATPHWLPARKALAEWLLKEAEQRNRSLWEIVEGDADLSDFGVTAKTIAARPDIMELLPPGKTAGNAANRASYFFRKHQDGEISRAGASGTNNSVQWSSSGECIGSPSKVLAK